MNRRQFTKTAAILAASGSIPTMVSAKPKKLTVAQIGTGHAHADGKMEALRKFPEHFEVIGVSEPDNKLWETNKNKKEYAGLKRFKVDDLLSRKDLDAVAIETAVPDLLPMAKKALLAGKHIHLDKPAGDNLKEFEIILKLAEMKRLVLQMGYMFRYNPGFLFMLDAVKKGWLGEIFEIDGVMSKKQDPSIWKYDAPSYNSTMAELGCHLIDMVIALMGKPDKVTSFRRQTLKINDIYENELAVFEYPNAICSVRSALVEVEGWERRQFVVCGTKGTIEIKPLEDPVLKLSLDQPRGQFKKGSQFVDLTPNGDRYDKQLQDFAGMIRGEKKPDYSYKHDLFTQEAVLKAAGLL